MRKLSFKPLRNTIVRHVVMAFIALLRSIYRLLYGLRVEGMQNVPAEGPYILGVDEYSLIGSLLTSLFLGPALLEANRKRRNSTVSYIHEELFTLPIMGSAFKSSAALGFGYIYPLRAAGAGNLALTLLDGYRILSQRGIAMLNPEGDMPWDGRPLPLGQAMAWLGLHTAAPIVPVVGQIGSYDIWPRWQTRPSGRGTLRQIIGKPFKLTDTPQIKITQQDLVEANARIAAEFTRLRYGPGGIREWAGEPVRNGAPIQSPIDLALPSGPVATHPIESRPQVPVMRRGVAQLLWQCPICRTNDALVHEHPRFRTQTVQCAACDTRWELRRVIGHDFRLKVVQGHPEWLGLDMALTTWIDFMRRNFPPEPITATGVDLREEQVYLEAAQVSLVPRPSNPLFDGWQGSEAPLTQPSVRSEIPTWQSIGQGKLLLTNRRLLWQGPQGELSFMLPSVTSVQLWMFNILVVKYGTAHYLFKVSGEVGFKWTAYLDALIAADAERATATHALAARVAV